MVHYESEEILIISIYIDNFLIISKKLDTI